SGLAEQAQAEPEHQPVVPVVERFERAHVARTDSLHQADPGIHRAGLRVVNAVTPGVTRGRGGRMGRTVEPGVMRETAADLGDLRERLSAARSVTVLT